MKALKALRDKVQRFPLSPGVYLMKGKRGEALYVGKAKLLRRRALSYFKPASRLSLKNQFLMSKTADMECIVTQNEVEAFLLEASLIKKRQPKYNIRLKDDKAYPYIRCSLSAPFPKLTFERKVRDRSSAYFGPYTQASAARHILSFTNKSFQLRDCSDRDFKTRKRPCLTHQMGHCSAPCVGKVSPSRYQSQAKKALMFLKGQGAPLRRSLLSLMQKASRKLDFEKAAEARDSLAALNMLEQKQSVIDHGKRFLDALSLAGDSRGTWIEMLYMRSGRLIGSRGWLLKGEGQTEETLLSFLNQYYEENIIPNELLVDFTLKKSRRQLLRKALSNRRGRQVKVSAQPPKAHALLKMARLNAEKRFEAEINEAGAVERALLEIQKKLRLRGLPRRMECFDISHWQGKAAVASMAVFQDGEPLKNAYRRYNVKGGAAQDDFKSLAEALTRRLKRLAEPPDLILIDGGKGQLSAAGKAVRKLGLGHIPLASVAKDRLKSKPGCGGAVSRATVLAARREGGKPGGAPAGKTASSAADKAKSAADGKAASSAAPAAAKTAKEAAGGAAAGMPELESSGERFYIEGRKNSLSFLPSSKGFRMLLALRDEAHRFALTAHRKKRAALLFKNDLALVPGIGDKRQQALMRRFGSLQSLSQASEEEIAATPVPLPLAKKIKAFLKQRL